MQSTTQLALAQAGQQRPLHYVAERLDDLPQLGWLLFA